MLSKPFFLFFRFLNISEAFLCLQVFVWDSMCICIVTCVCWACFENLWYLLYYIWLKIPFPAHFICLSPKLMWKLQHCNFWPLLSLTQADVKTLSLQLLTPSHSRTIMTQHKMFSHHGGRSEQKRWQTGSAAQLHTCPLDRKQLPAGKGLQS